MKLNFIVDADSFRLLQDEIGIGRIVELPPSDASLVAPHIKGHPETVYAAASGVNVSNTYGLFQEGEMQWQSNG